MHRGRDCMQVSFPAQRLRLSAQRPRLYAGVLPSAEAQTVCTEAEIVCRCSSQRRGPDCMHRGRDCMREFFTAQRPRLYAEELRSEGAERVCTEAEIVWRGTSKRRGGDCMHRDREWMKKR